MKKIKNKSQGTDEKCSLAFLYAGKGVCLSRGTPGHGEAARLRQPDACLLLYKEEKENMPKVVAL